MKKTIKSSPLLIMFLFLYPFNAFPDVNVSEKGVECDGIVFTGFFEDYSKYEFSLFLKAYNKKEVDEKIKYHFWGVDAEVPNTVIAKIGFTINNKHILFPTEAFGDLCDVILPCGVYLMQKDKVVLVYLKGGDAAGAYTAIFEFSHERLIKRTIQFVNPEGDLDTVVNKY